LPLKPAKVDSAVGNLVPDAAEESFSIAMESFYLAEESFSIVMESFSIAKESLSIAVEGLSIVVEGFSIAGKGFSVAMEKPFPAMEKVESTTSKSGAKGHEPKPARLTAARPRVGSYRVMPGQNHPR